VKAQNWRGRFRCLVCGEPIATRKSVHDRCKKDPIAPTSAMTGALDRAWRESRAKNSESVRSWTKEDGEAKMREMFPDLAERTRE